MRPVAEDRPARAASAPPGAAPIPNELAEHVALDAGAGSALHIVSSQVEDLWTFVALHQAVVRGLLTGLDVEVATEQAGQLLLVQGTEVELSAAPSRSAATVPR
jgi:hypothetical protein